MNLYSWLEYIYIIDTTSKHEIHFHNFMVKTPPPSRVSDGINGILLQPFGRGDEGGRGGLKSGEGDVFKIYRFIRCKHKFSQHCMFNIHRHKYNYLIYVPTPSSDGNTKKLLNLEIDQAHNIQQLAFLY
jgi:hypothetical protein